MSLIELIFATLSRLALLFNNSRFKAVGDERHPSQGVSTWTAPRFDRTGSVAR